MAFGGAVLLAQLSVFGVVNGVDVTELEVGSDVPLVPDVGCAAASGALVRPIETAATAATTR